MKKYIDEKTLNERGHVSDLEGDSINFKWGKKDCVMNIEQMKDKIYLINFGLQLMFQINYIIIMI